MAAGRSAGLMSGLSHRQCTSSTVEAACRVVGRKSLAQVTPDERTRDLGRGSRILDISNFGSNTKVYCDDSSLAPQPVARSLVEPE